MDVVVGPDVGGRVAVEGGDVFGTPGNVLAVVESPQAEATSARAAQPRITLEDLIWER
jgi:hypothetical protein